MTTLPDFISNPDPSIYRTGSYVVLDFETTTKDKGDALNPENDLLLAVWFVVKDGVIEKAKWKFANETLQRDLVNDIRNADFLVAHNTKFELQWLARAGLDLHDVLVYDTQIAEYVMLGNRKKPLDLESCCSRYDIPAKESLVSKLIKRGVDTRSIPSGWLLKYCKQDVLITYHLMQEQLKCIGDKLLKVQYNRCLLAPCLADIESNGATLDKDRVEQLYRETSQELADVNNELEELSNGINVGSSHQLAHWLYGDLKFKELRRYGKLQRNQANKQFPEGMPKTDLGTIMDLKAKTKKQRRVKELLLTQSKLNAKIVKNLMFFRGVCDNYDGTFYYKFNQTVTVTHRLSSSGKKIQVKVGKKMVDKSAQGQNIPRSMKPLFCASSEDRCIGETDGSQLEFRTAGHLGKDNQARQDVLNDEDIHQVTADTLTEAGEETTRQEAKASTFRPLFAGRSGSPAVIEYCDFFRAKYHEISAEQVRWAQQAVATGKVETEWGLIFYFPGTRPKQDGTYTNFTNICNYPIQSFASAEIIPTALVHFWHLSKDQDFRIINTIHDSIITDIPKEAKLEYVKLSAECMLTYVPEFLRNLYGTELFVPLGCGIKVGSHWNDPEVFEEIPESVAGYLTEVKSGGRELAFDMHRTETPHAWQ